MKEKSEVKMNVKECSNVKICIKCRDKCWSSKVNYCWECYKYEMYESR